MGMGFEVELKPVVVASWLLGEGGHEDEAE
jgi:hypothetical protein